MAYVVKERESLRNINLFLIEDDDGDAKAVTRAFNKAQIANPIVRAYDGVEALEILHNKEHSRCPHEPFIILLDLNMPRMNGFEFLEQLRNDPEFKKTVVFILTTSKSDEDKSKAYDFNIAGYIVKETAGRDFLHLINMIDDYWHLVELP